MPIPIDIRENNLLQEDPQLFQTLLADHTTQENIFWATDSYADLGKGYAWHDVITIESITGNHGNLIMPRAMKSRNEQQRRSRQMAEVFTPSWLVAKMNNVIDEEWANQHEEQADTEKAWQTYLLATCLEITCGEAPFLTSRYDTVTGEAIPIDKRMGILDRKLRLVNQNSTDEQWTYWALLALGSVYGYEWQGDNLLLAREALLATFIEYHEQRFNHKPDKAILLKAAEIIAWNVWQMDGLKAVVPCSCHEELHTSNELFAENTTTSTPCPGCSENKIMAHNGLRCKLRRWIPSCNETPDHFDCLYTDFVNKNTKTQHKTKWLMKFDFVIGNPPYQQESNGANESDTPLYHYFYDSAIAISNKVELITPARFLFDVGGTPSVWNKKMLKSNHFKVLSYFQNSGKVFSNTDIKGGVAISYYDINREYEPIGLFSQYSEIGTIFKKTRKISNKNLSSIITNRGVYRYSQNAYSEYPDTLQRTADSRIAPSSFERMPKLFKDTMPNDKEKYIRIYGKLGKEGRVFKWFKEKYVKPTENIDKYKVVVPKANGSGAFGEVITNPVILGPGIGFTETFISIGETNEKEAKAILSYVKTKFARAMLSVLKVTQNNAKPTWKYVPLQDFTSSSDIDWSKSVHEIDLQLYDKYGLNEEERNFIETHVKEMD